MSNAEYLIENAIFSCVIGVPFDSDVNAKYTNCTVEEASRMAQHILYSLYNGIAPGEARKAIYAKWVTTNGVQRCSNCKHVRPYDVYGDDVDYWDVNYCPNCGAITNDKT